LLGSDTTSPYAFSWTPTATGAISLTAKATDSGNVVTTSAAISVTVVAQDGAPSAFNFGTATAAVNAVSTSAERTPVGYNIPIAISITGGSYSIDGAAYVTTVGTLNPGGRLRVRVTAGGTVGSTRTATLTAGGVNATYVLTAN